MESQPGISEFDPSQQYGGYEEFEDAEYLPQYRELLEELVECVVPKEFRHLVTWRTKQPDPSNEDCYLRSGWVSWKYTPSRQY